MEFWKGSAGPGLVDLEELDEESAPPINYKKWDGIYFGVM